MAASHPHPALRADLPRRGGGCWRRSMGEMLEKDMRDMKAFIEGGG